MNLFTKIYLKFFIRDGFSYANYLKRENILHSQGDNCFISQSANIPDPYLTAIGSNVWITMGCNLLCHDASIIMLNIISSGHLDRVGPIIIGDNCFLGNNVTILPDIRIGSNTIVGTASLVTKDIPDNTVYAGNPARFICSLDEYLLKTEANTQKYPWKDLLKKNSVHIYDKELEVRLRRERINYFFNSEKDS